MYVRRADHGRGPLLELTASFPTEACLLRACLLLGVGLVRDFARRGLAPPSLLFRLFCVLLPRRLSGYAPSGNFQSFS